MKRAGVDAPLAQGGDLIVHQCDQRRDDDAGAGAAKGGDLVADAFAAARRHQDKRILAGDDMPDGGFLLSAKAREPEHAVQNLDGVRPNVIVAHGIRLISRG